MRSPVRLLLTAQVCLFVCLFICVLLIPHYLFESNEGGVSNYGTFAKTIVPYTLGFGVCGILTILSARSLPRSLSSRKLLSPDLVVLGILYLLVLVSTYPYKHGAGYDVLHQLSGALLVLYTVALGAWLSLLRARSTAALLIFAAQIIGFLLEVLNYFGLVHILFVAELLESMAFGALLIYSVKLFTVQDVL